MLINIALIGGIRQILANAGAIGSVQKETCQIPSYFKFVGFAEG